VNHRPAELHFLFRLAVVFLIASIFDSRVTNRSTHTIDATKLPQAIWQLGNEGSGSI
jgi:hypothetical protein